MIQNFDIPAWGGFNGSMSVDIAPTWSFRGDDQPAVGGRVGGHNDITYIPPIGEDIGHGYQYISSIVGDIWHCASSGTLSYSFASKPYSGWMPYLSLVATAEGYNYLPISFNLSTYWLDKIFQYFLGPSKSASLGSPGYQYKEGDSTNHIASSTYELKYSDVEVPFVPKFWTQEGVFPSWDLSGTSITASFVSMLTKTFEQLNAILVILTGGTFSNFGREDTSPSVVSAVSAAQAVVDDGERNSVYNRLDRLESSVAQLIALVTYNYYLSGASIDSGAASSDKVAANVLTLLKNLLGSGGAENAPE